jgi:hypothetical protein
MTISDDELKERMLEGTVSVADVPAGTLITDAGIAALIKTYQRLGRTLTRAETQEVLDNLP